MGPLNEKEILELVCTLEPGNKKPPNSIIKKAISSALNIRTHFNNVVSFSAICLRESGNGNGVYQLVISASKAFGGPGFSHKVAMALRQSRRVKNVRCEAPRAQTPPPADRQVHRRPVSWADKVRGNIARPSYVKPVPATSVRGASPPMQAPPTQGQVTQPTVSPAATGKPPVSSGPPAQDRWRKSSSRCKPS